MGDTVQVRQGDRGTFILTVKGALAEEKSPGQLLYSLTLLIQEIVRGSRRLGQLFVLDLTDASLEKSDTGVIEEASAWAIANGAVLVAADPYGLLRLPHSVRTFDSVGDAIRIAKTRSTPVPVQIFLEDESTAGEVELALQDVLGHFGVEHLDGPPPVCGSWYRCLTGWMRNDGQSPIAADLARAMDMQLVDRYQVGIDITTSNAVATLIAALEKTPGAVIQAGSVLLVKYDGTVVVRQLTPSEMIYWHRNPGLFRDPAQALAELQQAAAELRLGRPYR